MESEQGYIHYRKASVVLYYLKEMIGEDAVNRALRKVIQQYAYTRRRTHLVRPGRCVARRDAAADSNT